MSAGLILQASPVPAASCGLINKETVVKPITFANTKDGWNVLLERLERLETIPSQIVIGMEATSR